MEKHAIFSTLDPLATIQLIYSTDLFRLKGPGFCSARAKK